MKTYNQFIIEAYSVRQDINEAIPLVAAAVPAAMKAAGWGLAAWQAYQAAQKLRRGDYKGAAVDAALAIPSTRIAGVAGRALKLGSRGKNLIKQGVRATKAGVIGNELKKELSATAPRPATPPATAPRPATPPATAPRPAIASSMVLARKGGVQGKLDKATGNWTKGDWSQKESDRYKRVAAAMRRSSS